MSWRRTKKLDHFNDKEESAWKYTLLICQNWCALIGCRRSALQKTCRTDISYSLIICDADISAELSHLKIFTVRNLLIMQSGFKFPALKFPAIFGKPALLQITQIPGNFLVKGTLKWYFSVKNSLFCKMLIDFDGYSLENSFFWRKYVSKPS